MTGKTDSMGKLHMIFGAIDHGTRHIVSLRVLTNKSFSILRGHLCMAIGRHGKPRAIRTDNESVFTSRAFRSALLCLGIRHQRIDRGCPWMNGRIERFFGTLKQSLNRLAVENAGQLQASLDIINDWYCCVRPHANLNGATPLEAWCGIDPFRTNHAASNASTNGEGCSRAYASTGGNPPTRQHSYQGSGQTPAGESRLHTNELAKFASPAGRRVHFPDPGQPDFADQDRPDQQK